MRLSAMTAAHESTAALLIPSMDSMLSFCLVGETLDTRTLAILFETHERRRSVRLVVLPRSADRLCGKSLEIERPTDAIHPPGVAYSAAYDMGGHAIAVFPALPRAVAFDCAALDLVVSGDSCIWKIPLDALLHDGAERKSAWRDGDGAESSLKTKGLGRGGGPESDPLRKDARLKQVAVMAEVVAGCASERGCSDGAPLSARFLPLSSMTFDAHASNLYACDTYNHRVFALTRSAKASSRREFFDLATLAGSRTAQEGHVDGACLTSRFCRPSSVVAVRAGQEDSPILYVADEGNNCVRRVARGFVATLGITMKASRAPCGLGPFMGKNASSADDREEENSSHPLHSPQCLALQPDGRRLYVGCGPGIAHIDLSAGVPGHTDHGCASTLAPHKNSRPHLGACVASPLAARHKEFDDTLQLQFTGEWISPSDRYSIPCYGRSALRTLAVFENVIGGSPQFECGGAVARHLWIAEYSRAITIVHVLDERSVTEAMRCTCPTLETFVSDVLSLICAYVLSCI